jgi:hypothetical protein
MLGTGWVQDKEHQESSGIRRTAFFEKGVSSYNVYNLHQTHSLISLGIIAFSKLLRK